MLSGAINGETALTIRADAAGRRFALRQDHAGDAGIGAAPAADSPAGRSAGRAVHAAGRGDRAGGVGRCSGEPIRFLAVLVVATPCPLLIAIPVAIIGSISLAARRGIIIRDPAVLEQVDTCRTVIFDKTGTLTYGEPRLVEQLVVAGFQSARRADRWPPAWSATRNIRCRKRYCWKPQRERLAPSEAEEIREKPGEGPARNSCGPASANHQPQQTGGDKARVASINCRRWPADWNASF